MDIGFRRYLLEVITLQLEGVEILSRSSLRTIVGQLLLLSVLVQSRLSGVTEPSFCGKEGPVIYFVTTHSSTFCVAGDLDVARER